VDDASGRPRSGATHHSQLGTNRAMSCVVCMPADVFLRLLDVVQTRFTVKGPGATA